MLTFSHSFLYVAWVVITVTRPASFLMGLGSLTFIVRLVAGQGEAIHLRGLPPLSPWTGQEETSPVRGGCPSKALDSLDGTAFPQYKVEWLYCRDSVTFLLSPPGLGPAIVEFDLQFWILNSYKNVVCDEVSFWK
jgi:hypothetical protein